MHILWFLEGIRNRDRTEGYVNLVPKAGLEPARPRSLPPQGSVSTNFTTSANSINDPNYRCQVGSAHLPHQMMAVTSHLAEAHPRLLEPLFPAAVLRLPMANLQPHPVMTDS